MRTLDYPPSNILRILSFSSFSSLFSFSSFTKHAQPTHANVCQPGDVRCVLIPWVVTYLAVFLLQGGPGSSSMGILSNLR